MAKRLNIESNSIYGHLTVIKEAPHRRLPSGQINRFFLCRCVCGIEKEIRLLHLIRNRIDSCGCIKATRNGLSTTKLFKVYKGMILRCSGKTKDSHRYFNRGIRICKEWGDFNNFYNWALSNGYKEKLQIDRIDNSKGYSPNNCRFVTSKENCNNREITFYVTYKETKISLKMLLLELGRCKDYHTIRRRILRGWGHDDAIDTPIKKGNYKRGAIHLQHNANVGTPIDVRS